MTAFDPGNRLIAALDVPDREQAQALAEKLAGEVALFKIGLELFLAEGPALVRWFVERGHRVMLDLKLHDIPATVTRATMRAAALGVDLLTVHTAGGRDMLGAAVWAANQARRSGRGDLGILGVTVLTSLDQATLGQVGVVGRVDDVVALRARMAERTGCLGVVASPREAERLRAQADDSFLIVTPGIRPSGHRLGADDQRRITAPIEARKAGADLLVVGRPIRDAEDPAQAARAIAAEIAGAAGKEAASADATKDQ